MEKYIKLVEQAQEGKAVQEEEKVNRVLRFSFGEEKDEQSKDEIIKDQEQKAIVPTILAERSSSQAVQVKKE